MMNWLIPPALPENAIDRPRLTRQLTRPIVLITAPSGYGKTTLLNQWQDVLSAGVVWVSLDNEANTVYTFWAAVLLAWQKIKPGYELPLTLLQSPAPLPVEPQAATQTVAAPAHQASPPRPKDLKSGTLLAVPAAVGATGATRFPAQPR